MTDDYINPEYEPTVREGYITEALEIIVGISKLVTMDNGDIAAFIEGYLQGKEKGGKL